MQKQNNSQFIKMTETPLIKLLIGLAIPAVISMTVTNIYNIADTAFVGSLGTSQSGATGVVFSFMTILQSVAFMCGQGSGSIMSRKLGSMENEQATKYSSTGFFLSLTLGALIGIVSLIFMKPFLIVLGSTDTILPYAKIYVSCIAVAAPFFTSSLTLNNLLRYEGKAKLGTLGMMTGAVLNIALDALLMKVFKMGISGAGIATAISQLISFIILVFMFVSGKTQTKISVKYISKDLNDTLNIIMTGFPSLIRQGLTGVSAILLNRCAGVYGDPAIAAMSCVSRIGFFSMAVAIGIGQGFQPISSYNFGANKKDRVRKAFKTALIGEEIVIFLLAVPMFIFSPFLISLLRNDPEVIKIGGRALRFFCAAQIFIPLTMMVEMGFQSIGEKWLAILGSSLRSGLLMIPSLIILSYLRGLKGIEEAQPLSFVLSFFACLFLYKIYLDRLKD